MATVLCQRKEFTENQLMSIRENAWKVKLSRLWIDNNLDHDVALYPYELVTYGETGQVCQNWMQYQLIEKIS